MQCTRVPIVPESKAKIVNTLEGLVSISKACTRFKPLKVLLT